jgi:RimJ/RimL family protein N-acetyltransferase
VKILETERTVIREVVEADAAFVLDLLNQPSFLKYIGDRGVRNLADAREFLETRYRQSYRDFGYGLYVVELKETGAAAGLCGFVKRDTLPDPDIGFAFLPQFWSQGYAHEAAAAVMKYGRDILGLTRILAITTQDNETSGRLLAKIGFKFDGLIKMPTDENELKLFSADI